jgi:hypothetical protein
MCVCLYIHHILMYVEKKKSSLYIKAFTLNNNNNKPNEKDIQRRGGRQKGKIVKTWKRESI